MDVFTNYYHRIEQLHSLLAQISLILAISLSFLGERIVVILFGTAYAESGLVLSIHVWSAVFGFMSSATALWYVAEGLTTLITWRTILGGLINVILNFCLIPRYEATGAALATVISYGFVGWIINFFQLKTRRIFFIQTRALLPWNLISMAKTVK
jgi:polysaccharide transporter, PST family